jgi:hypothetical protein
MSSRPGRVRAARLTDLAALGDLSRLSHDANGRDAPGVRSLGLPIHPINLGVFSLFRMPLAAFRPTDQLYVYEEGNRLSGLARVERDSARDEWTIVELDAIGFMEAGDIRLRLVQHLLRDGARRGVARVHVACADEGGNVELFMQAGFMSYGQERILYRPADEPVPAVEESGGSRPDPIRPDGIRPAVPLDALALSRLHASVTPAPVARIESYRLSDWERQGSGWRVPRSSLSPILRFADVEPFVQEAPDGGPRGSPDGTRLAGFVQVGVAKEDQPDYLRVLALPGLDVTPLIRYGLGTIAERASRRGSAMGHGRGVLCPVRTYEAPVDRRLEDHGFEATATVTLLLKDALVRVAEPALVPAIR